MGKIEEAAAAAGETAETYVPRKIEEVGSVQNAAIHVFKVVPNTLNYWLERNGFDVVHTVHVVKREKVDA